MKSIAIIGTGITGMACGYFLHRDFDITLYEKNDYVGGHTNTITVDEDGQPVRMDTGFMVFNHETYPYLKRLFEELHVPTKPTAMSFSVQHVPSGLEFCGSGINGLFAQRRNLLRPRFWRLLKDIGAFNTRSPEVLETEHFDNYTLRHYVQENGWGRDLLDHYLIPMSSAVWSTPPDKMVDFPAVTLIRFFKNHGFLGLNTQHPWYTVVNGSWTYRDLLIKPFQDRIRTACGAVSVRRKEGKAIVKDARGTETSYDHVILASHANQSLSLLEDATPLERELLAPFQYEKNKATVHTDTSVMPKTRAAWSSWNYRIAAAGRPSCSTDALRSRCVQHLCVKARRYRVCGVATSPPQSPALLLATLSFRYPDRRQRRQHA